MKKYIIIALIAFCLCESNLLALRKRGDYFNRPQIGINCGPYAPLFDVSEKVDSALGVGLFTRFSMPYQPIKLGFDFMYFKNESFTVNALQVIPMFGSLQYRLPIPSPLNFMVKAGGGASYLTVYPDEVDRWDPTIVTGGEVSFPAGKIFNIGLQVNYITLVEKHLEDAEYNGHFFNASLTIFFNL